MERDRKTQKAPERIGSLVIGERVHNYEIISKIGEGGMGVVYLASHQFFERKAAFKVLHPDLSSDENSVRRFMNEARAANAIRHPNIIEVVDTGFLPRSGAPYLMTEYLEGESLRARMDRGERLPFETALQIAGQTASALAAAHDQGIVHRDLKPENLFLLSRPGNADFVKVLDFGIAKLHTDHPGQQFHTEPGMLVGTPRYMSPEQCRGGSSPIDHRTDIYSLGIVLYEMLCGVAPFEGEGFGELIAIQLTREPEPLRSHVPDIPPYVEAAVLRALAKQPSDRFPSMREFRAALGSAALPKVPTPTGYRLESELPAGLNDRPRSTSGRAGRTGSLVRRGMLAAFLLVAGVTAAVAWKGWPARSTRSGGNRESRVLYQTANPDASAPVAPAGPAAGEAPPPPAELTVPGGGAVAAPDRADRRRSSQRTPAAKQSGKDAGNDAGKAAGKAKPGKARAPSRARPTNPAPPKKFVPPLW